MVCGGVSGGGGGGVCGGVCVWQRADRIVSLPRVRPVAPRVVEQGLARVLGV